MPEDKADKQPQAAEEALSDVWEATFRANEALVTVYATGSKEYARLGMQVLKSRALALAAALDDLMEATSG